MVGVYWGRTSFNFRCLCGDYYFTLLVDVCLRCIRSWGVNKCSTVDMYFITFVFNVSWSMAFGRFFSPKFSGFSRLTSWSQRRTSLRPSTSIWPLSWGRGQRPPKMPCLPVRWRNWYICAVWLSVASSNRWLHLDLNIVIRLSLCFAVLRMILWLV